jgi:hypothetical protein
MIYVKCQHFDRDTRTGICEECGGGYVYCDNCMDKDKSICQDCSIDEDIIQTIINIQNRDWL